MSQTYIIQGRHFGVLHVGPATKKIQNTKNLKLSNLALLTYLLTYLGTYLNKLVGTYEGSNQPTMI